MVSNVNAPVCELVASDSDSEVNSEQAIQMYAKICQLILRRGNMDQNSFSYVSPCPNKSFVNAVATKKSEEDLDINVVRRKIETLGQLGHPIIIELLLLPKTSLNNTLSKCLPAILVEQWMIQLLPRRLVTECSKSLAVLSNEIYGYCSSSMVNKLLRGENSSLNTIKIKDLRCAYRLTNLREANVFSSCWFFINTEELSANSNALQEDERESSDYGALVRHSSRISITPHHRAQTTIRTKLIKRTYLCSSSMPSHSHEHDTNGICSSHAFTRLSVSRTDVLDTTVASILELPTAPLSLEPSLFPMQDGIASMSLPAKRTIEVPSILPVDNSQKHVVLPKSPVVIMSNWNPHQATSRLEHPNQIFQTKGKLDDCIHEFNSLNVHKKQKHKKQQVNTSALENSFDTTEAEMDGEVTLRPNRGRKLSSRASNSFSEVGFPMSNTKSFHWKTRLPLQSSPIPVKRYNSTSFDFDDSIELSCSKSPQVFHVNHSPSGSKTTENYLSARISFRFDEKRNPAAENQETNWEKTSHQRPVTLSLKRPCQKEQRQRHSLKRRSSEGEGGTMSFSAPTFHTSPPGCVPPPGYASVGNSPSTSQPVMSQQLLINFEESMLNGRLPPSGIVEGFQVEIGASGSFYPGHLKLPVTAYFFNLSDDNAPSPYLGFVNLSNLSNKRGYHVPKLGSIQLTLFNPSSSVVKVFVIQYNLEDMPANCQTFLRQRTVYMPVGKGSGPEAPTVGQDPLQTVASSHGLLFMSGATSTTANTSSNRTSLGTFHPEASIFQADELAELPAYLRYLVHLRFHTTKSNNLYLHTDIRLIFARDKFEFDPRVATYEMRSFIDGPSNPRYSPKK